MRYCAGKVYAHMMHLLISGVLKTFSRNASVTTVHLIDMALFKLPDYFGGCGSDRVAAFHIKQASKI